MPARIFFIDHLCPTVYSPPKSLGFLVLLRVWSMVLELIGFAPTLPNRQRQYKVHWSKITEYRTVNISSFFLGKEIRELKLLYKISIDTSIELHWKTRHCECITTSKQNYFYIPRFVDGHVYRHDYVEKLNLWVARGENTLKIPQPILVQNSKGKFENLVAKSLGYGFRLDSFFPDSSGGEYTVPPWGE